MCFAPRSGNVFNLIQAGVDNNGKLQALEAKYYTNGGWSMDLSMAVTALH